MKDMIESRIANLAPPPPLARPHPGERLSLEDLLAQLSDASDSQLLRLRSSELLSHLQVVSYRYYNGDVAVVDEFLQLYGLDQRRPLAVP